MGCSVVRNKLDRRYSSQIQKKLVCRVISSDSIGTFSSSISGTIYRENSATLKKCLKIQILPISPKMSFNDLTLEKTQLFRQSLEYLPYYSLLKEFYSAFSSSERNFCNRVHESCVDNFLSFKLSDIFFFINFIKFFI